MKTVFSNAEIPHIFAAQSQEFGRNAGNSYWFEGSTLYSYREPIARFCGEIVIFSADSFSVTTSRHQSKARYALRHVESVAVPSLRDLCDILDRKSERAALEYIKARMNRIAALEEQLPRKRSDWVIRVFRDEIAQNEHACEIAWRAIGKRGDWRKSAGKALAAKLRKEKRERFERSLGSLQFAIEQGIANAIARANDWLHEPGARDKLFRLENTVSDIMRRDELGALKDSATWCEARKIMGKAWCAQYAALANQLPALAEPFAIDAHQLRGEIDEIERKEQAERLADWLALKPNVRAPNMRDVVCRVVNGDTVETNKGARVPLADALRVVRLADACRKRGEAMRKESFATGVYKGIVIDSAGNVTIGCHEISWRAISECVALFKPEALA